MDRRKFMAAAAGAAAAAPAMREIVAPQVPGIPPSAAGQYIGGTAESGMGQKGVDTPNEHYLAEMVQQKKRLDGILDGSVSLDGRWRKNFCEGGDAAIESIDSLKSVSVGQKARMRSHIHRERAIEEAFHQAELERKNIVRRLERYSKQYNMSVAELVRRGTNWLLQNGVSLTGGDSGEDMLG